MAIALIAPAADAFKTSSFDLSFIMATSFVDKVA